jgi:uncharacterized hydrophobic protein (TIGR00341 family)
MALRVMQIYIPGDPQVQLDEVLEGHEILGRWRDDDGSRVMVQLVLPAEETEPVMDRFEDRFGTKEGFHIVLFPIEAARPQQEKPDEAEYDAPTRAPAERVGRVSRDELYNEVTDGLNVDRGMVAMAALSAAVAAVGLIRGDVAVIIGAMVIAPLLGPNIALSLGTTLGDYRLIGDALRTNLAGVSVAFLLAVLIGVIFTIDPAGSEIASRKNADFGQVALALGAGAAGTLAYTRGLSGAVIGVMVAVALMPPLVTSGMLLGEGEFDGAGGAMMLTLANVVGINLASTGMFLAQGVRPRRWYDAQRARRRAFEAIALWLALLALLVAILVIAERT